MEERKTGTRLILGGARPDRCVRTWLVPLGLVTVLAAAGCMPDFEPASELGDRPQMLAIRAEPPEVTPGGSAALDAVLHEPGGPLHLAWIACYADPRGWSQTCVADALAAGAELVPCDGVSQAPICVASMEATAVVPVPAWVTPAIPDAAGVPVESVVHVTLVASEEPDPLVACGEALERTKPTAGCLLGSKRLMVSERPLGERNRNPVVGSLEVDGASVEAGGVVAVEAGGGDPGELRVSLALALDPVSVDEAVDDSGNPDEAFLELRWYADCGGFSKDSARIRCDPLPGALPGDPPGCEVEGTVWRPRQSGACVVHAVVSDGRGGVGRWSQAFLVGQ
ncbi:MAG: hypothetical protein RBU30_06235 [Polyangia bacterium]|jgi:hypothetical protein|nr:hypothetical protein [Polyangia bacterium]